MTMGIVKERNANFGGLLRCLLRRLSRGKLFRRGGWLMIIRIGLCQGDISLSLR
jgi:hypothetical protein